MRFEDCQIGAGDDIWGIDENLYVFVGYDNVVGEASICSDDPYMYGEQLPWTEKLRLADMMIERWKRYRDAVIVS